MNRRFSQKSSRSRLSTAENRLVTITRALVRSARLIVVDEPTAALSMAESERLFGIIRELSRSGIAVLYVEIGWTPVRDFDPITRSNTT